MLDSPRTRVPLIVGSLLFSVLPLTGVLFVPPGSVAFFVLIGLGGMSLYASGPLVVVEAQDRAPTRDVSAAAMILGFSTGIAALLYIGVGWLQDALGLEPAMLLSFSVLLPAALLIGATLRAKEPPVTA